MKNYYNKQNIDFFNKLYVFIKFPSLSFSSILLHTHSFKPILILMLPKKVIVTIMFSRI